MGNASGSELVVATWNVNGIRARAEQFLEWLAEEQPDVVCLQELKAAPEQLPPELVELEEYWSYWHGSLGGYSGVSLHFRKERFPESPVFGHPEFDMESRLVEARVGTTVFISVYIPNGGKDYPAKLDFLNAMQAYTSRLLEEGNQVILGGDLNVTRTEKDVHPSQQDESVIGQRPDERKLFEEFLGAGLIDVARSLDPENNRLFTWWPFWKHARSRNLGWRIDYILASSGIAELAEHITVQKDTGTSDHAPFMVTFRLPEL